MSTTINDNDLQRVTWIFFLGADLSAKEKIELQGKKPRQIIHSNTRFKHNPFNMEKSKESIQEAANTQAIMKSGRIGVDGKEVLPSDTPRVNGYSFVSDPSPAPGIGKRDCPCSLRCFKLIFIHKT